MRKAAIILFILIFSGSSLLSVLAFKYGQKQIKREIKHRIFSGIDPSQLECIAIAEKDIGRSDDVFHFVDKNEFKYYGRMYDVVRRETRGDTVCFYSIRDEKEEKLIADFIREMKKNNGPNSFPFDEDLLKLLSFQLEGIENDFDYDGIVRFEGNHFFGLKEENPISNAREVPSPPPKY